MLNKKRLRLSKEIKNETFLSKLYDILNIKNYEKIIHWSENGQEIVISNMVNLSNVILPKYYKHKNYTSFVRQLNMYGFKKIKSKPGEDEERFEHSEFKRSCTKENVQKISRKKKSKTKFLNKKIINIDINKNIISSNLVNSNNNTLNNSVINNDSNIISKNSNLNSNTLTIIDNNILNYLILKNEENMKNLNRLEKEVDDLKKQNTQLNSQIQLCNNNSLVHNNFFKKMKGLFIFLMAMIIKRQKNNIQIKECQLENNNKDELEQKMNSFKNFIYKYINFHILKQLQSPTNPSMRNNNSIIRNLDNNNNNIIINNNSLNNSNINNNSILNDNINNRKIQKEVSFCIISSEKINNPSVLFSDSANIRNNNVFNDSLYDDFPFFNFHDEKFN